jgi:hypothetical protein
VAAHTSDKERTALACTLSGTAVLVLFLVGSLSSRAKAQSEATGPTDSTLRSTFARIAADDRQTIRVTSSETGRLEGNSVSLLNDSVFVSTKSGLRAIAVANVDSVWIYRGTAAPILGLVAAVPCALYGAAVGGFIAGDPDGGRHSAAQGILFPIIGLVAGGAVCGLVGAGVGSLIERWRLEYVRL